MFKPFFAFYGILEETEGIRRCGPGGSVLWFSAEPPSCSVLFIYPQLLWNDNMESASKLTHVLPQR